MFDIMMLSGAIGMQAALKQAKEEEASDATLSEDAASAAVWAQEGGNSLLEEAQTLAMTALDELNSKIEQAIPALSLSEVTSKKEA
jgi:hypothetical protein